MGVFKNTEKFIRTYANQVEQEMESRLRGHGKYASGTLYDSIRYEIKETSTTFELTFKMTDYGKFVDKGVNGYDRNKHGSYRSEYSFKKKSGKGTGKKSKFITSLQKWCRIKGLPVGMAFPIRRNIWRFGIAPTNFFTIPATRRAKQFNAGVKKNMALDYDIQLQKIIKEEKG